MAFNGMCSGNDMLYASEGGLIPESRLKLKAPKTSYIITSNIQKNSQQIYKVEFSPAKGFFFNKNSIPNWIDLSFYSLPKKNGKRITAVHIVNKSLMSNNPYMLDSNAILYCHENETDLLRLIPFLIDISIQMKIDIISFDYTGFGDTKEKPKNTTLSEDGEITINFILSHLKYKINNLVIFGKGIGAIPSIHLAVMNQYQNCKSLILCMPLIIRSKIDIKNMRSIICKSLIIYEIENKDEIETNDMIYLCREIPNEKEWFPIKKKRKEMFQGFKRFMETSFEDIYITHRSKFITKLRDFVYPEEENMVKKIKNSGSIGESTDSETNLSSGHLEKMENKNINFEETNEVKNEIKIEEKKIDIFNQSAIHIHNDEDY
jgi:hypothetical protein